MGNSCLIWQDSLPENTEYKLRSILSAHRETPVLFRVDDIGGANDQVIGTLLELFRTYSTSLNLAVVPTWINESTWKSYSDYELESSLWCWHQHGFAHINHQKAGKKSEFGSARTCTEIKTDLENGNKHLKSIMGNAFTPIFTPPWNRCSKETLDALVQLNFSASSRSSDPKKILTQNLPEFPINIDLHTRKETNAELSWKNLYEEILNAGSGEYMGFMLHHLVMNKTGFKFLEILLKLIRDYNIPSLTFKEVLPQDKL